MTIIDLFITIGLPLVQKQFGTLFQDDPTAKAIKHTADAFPGFDGLSSQLKGWRLSPAFASLMLNLQSGDRESANESIVASFVEVAGFFDGDRTKESAHEVLYVFFKMLLSEMYQTSHGVAFLGARQEVLAEAVEHRHRELMSAIQSITIPFPISTTPHEQPYEQQPAEKQTHKRIDDARDLIPTGQILAAQALLQIIRAEVAQGSASTHIQFRIATNLGVCALELGDERAAADEFKAALKLKPGDKLALTNAARAAAIEGDSALALELSAKAREQDRTDSNATSVYLYSLYQAKGAAEIEKLLEQEPGIGDNPVCAATLGQIWLQAERFGDAEVCLKKAVGQNNIKPTAGILLAQAISRPVQNLIVGMPVATGLPPDCVERLEEAESYLTLSLAASVAKNNRRELYDALVARAAIRAMLGKVEESLQDSTQVIQAPERVDNRVRDGAYQNKAVALFQAGRIQEAISTLERITDSEVKQGCALTLGAAFVENKDHEKAVELLEPLWKTLEGIELFGVADLLLLSYGALKRADKVEGILSFLGNRYPNDPEALSLIALQRVRERKFQDAEQLLLRAQQSEERTDRPTILLADLYLRQSRFSDACGQYASVADTTYDNPILRNYVAALFNAGAYKSALDIAESLRRRLGKAIPTISEVEAKIREYIGDLSGARDVINELCEVDPTRTAHQIQVAYLDYRLGNRELARQKVLGIQFDAVRDDPECLIQIAQLRTFLEVGDALRFAYRARRLGFKDPAIHVAFIGIFLANVRANPIPVSLESVVVESVVNLRRNDEERTFKILTDSDLDSEKGELAQNDVLAILLLGHAKGEEVQLKSGAYEETPYTIAEIRDKYVAAFQETLAGFTTWFPHDPAIHRLEVKPNDLIDPGFVRLFASVDDHHRLTTQVVDLYRQGKLTLGAVSGLAGKPLPDVWAALAARRDDRILAATGTPTELPIQVKLLAAADRIVVDTTALLTIGHLDLFDKLSERFKEIITVQPTLDGIHSLLQSLRTIKPSGFIGKEGERYVLQEASDEGFQKWKQFLEKIQLFLETKAAIAPSRKALDVAKDEHAQAVAMLGAEAIGAVLVAQECGDILYSDDRTLRAIAKQTWNVDGVWSQALLTDLWNKEVITEREYRDLVKKLIIANYHFIQIDANGLFRVLEQNEFSVTAEVERVLKVLDGPDCSQASAVKIVADLLKRLARSNTILNHQFNAVLVLLLRSLMTGRISFEVLAALQTAINREFYMDPIGREDLLGRIRICVSQILPRRGWAP